MMTLQNGSFPPTVPSVSVQKPANTVRRPFEVYMRQVLRLKLACMSFQKVICGHTYPSILISTRLFSGHCFKLLGGLVRKLGNS